ncbi:hypothetical protein EHS25_001762 [Saitozyma podzolica]|uniref:Uncharacterized protein n=1 Tax=Saitozyma podzolica TaxID=1890683 RepID=A0A427YFB3_9TREE|nr:hypothetical protein EHS25_001762 [Saitozyma podzolica]
MNGSRWTWTPSRVPGHVLVGPAYALPQSRALTEAYLLVSKPVWGTTMPEAVGGPCLSASQKENWVYQQAAQANIFQGRAADAPSKAQIQALIDILNGLGWNGGIRSPTKSLDPNAWWHCTPSTDRSAIFQELSEMYQSDEEIRDLYEQARGSSHPYTLPCKAQPGNPDHRYQHKLQRTALVHWIAELIQGGVIDGTAFGLVLARITVLYQPWAGVKHAWTGGLDGTGFWDLLPGLGVGVTQFWLRRPSSTSHGTA